ncbi:MAG: uracil-DNA glycosylase [Anaerolineaceae bacterium]|jgi:DNA polymerase|nr:uracil-DNA glycosylase [Anaerolineaceae bacterium]
MKNLAEIAALVSKCQNCPLYHSRIQAVPGEGPENANVMFIGEGPGFHENQQGRPFVGQAGKFLDELLSAAGLRRETVFITNVVKCRPPGNRDPQPEELEACSKFLDRQIEIINPEMIVTLGRFSMAKFFGQVKISQIHGNMRKIGQRYIVAMYHPAAALHQPALKNTLLSDFAKLKNYMIQIKSENEIKDNNLKKYSPIAVEKDEDAPTQLSLF